MSIVLFHFTVAAQPGVSLSEVTAVKVNWTTPQGDHLRPITQYEVQYRRVGNGHKNPWHSVPTIKGSPPATHTYLEGLKINTAYWV